MTATTITWSYDNISSGILSYHQSILRCCARHTQPQARSKLSYRATLRPLIPPPEVSQFRPSYYYYTYIVSHTYITYHTTSRHTVYKWSPHYSLFNSSWSRPCWLTLLAIHDHRSGNYQPIIASYLSYCGEWKALTNNSPSFRFRLGPMTELNTAVLKNPSMAYGTLDFFFVLGCNCDVNVSAMDTSGLWLKKKRNLN